MKMRSRIKQEAKEEEPELDEDGNPIEKDPANNEEEEKDIPDGVKPGYTDVQISYRAFYVQAPDQAGSRSSVR